MPRRSSHSRYDTYDDEKKYDDPWMGYSDDFENPYRQSEQTTSRYGDPFSSHTFDNSSRTMDQNAYPPRTYETPYSSVREDRPSSSSSRSHRSSSRRQETSSRYEPSSYASSPFDQYTSTSSYDSPIPFDPYTSTSSRSNPDYAGDSLSSRYNQPTSSRYEHSSRRDSTLDSSSGIDLQSSFTRGVLGRDAPARPSRSSFAYTTPDNCDLYPSSPDRYWSGPTSDPFSSEKYASSKHNSSRKSRRRRSSRRYDD